MTELPKNQRLPQGVILDQQPPFVPKMVMTDELQSVMRDVLHQWEHRNRFEGLLKYGIRPLDRLLFFGPPGNGKTLTCYWIAQKLNIPMYRVLCNQLRGSYLGETTRCVADAMQFLDGLKTPAVCLWDEVESIFVSRQVSSGQCDREIAAALTVFMQAMDRWKAATLLVMATNLPEQLDPALLSRVEMRLEFKGPTPEQCDQLLEYWAELLHKHGGQEWGPRIREQLKREPAESFRELQQVIAWAARDWTAKHCD